MPVRFAPDLNGIELLERGVLPEGPFDLRRSRPQIGQRHQVDPQRPTREDLALLARDARRLKPVERPHREQTTVRPGEGDDTEEQAGIVMPLHQADVRRRHRDIAHPKAEPPNRGVAPDAPDQAGEAHHAAEERRPDDELQPDRSVPAKRREVDPVGDRSQIPPEALAPGGAQHHVAGDRRHVQPRIVRIVERKPMHRHLPAGLQRPLIGLGEVPVVVIRAVVSRDVATGDGFGLGATDVREHLPRVGEDDLRAAEGAAAASAAEAVDGPVAEHPDPDAIDADSRRPPRRIVARGPRRLGEGRGEFLVIGGEAGHLCGLERRYGHAGEIQRAGAREALLVRHSRHAGVHHHHARHEPGDEEHASGYSEPTVDVDDPPAPVEPPLQRPHRAQFVRIRTVAMTLNGSPG